MKCYLVSGDNGVIIHQHYHRAVRCQHCFIHGNIKRYDCFAEAEHAALEHLSEIAPYYVQIPARLELDEMVTVKKLLRENKTGMEDN